MKLIYISGPLSPKTYEGHEVFPTILRNVRRAMIAWWNIVYISLDERGNPRAAPICPHLTFYLYQEQPPYMSNYIKNNYFWYTMDLAIIERCDAVYMLDGWENSKGATLEKNHAEKHGIPVFTNLEDLARYFRWIK